MLYNCRYNPAKYAGIILLILLQASCAHFTKWGIAHTTSVETGADTYIGLLHQFGTTNSEVQAALYEHISTDAVLEPTASNRLRLALVKAWPGHPGHNTDAAKRLLQSVLDDKHELASDAENLARVFLLITEQQQILSNRTRTLTSELREAQKKLEALTNIERTVEPEQPITVPGNIQESSE